MSGEAARAMTEIEFRLARDGITLSDEERDRLIELTTVAKDWVRQITIPETRDAEPALTHHPK